jgi:DNA-binding MarR family transcriptional regulator
MTESIDLKVAEKILKALASSSRLEILTCIETGFANPGEIARKLSQHRSTVEKHLRVMLLAGLVEKSPSLNASRQLSIRYKITPKARPLLDVISKIE